MTVSNQPPQQPPPGQYGPPPTVNVYQQKGHGCRTAFIVLLILAVVGTIGFVILFIVGLQVT